MALRSDTTMCCSDWNARHVNLTEWQSNGMHNKMVQAMHTAPCGTKNKSRFSLKNSVFAVEVPRCQHFDNEKRYCRTDKEFYGSSGCNDALAFFKQCPCGENEKPQWASNK